jgi:phenylalanyl-tRNA synthetase alpha chain
MTSDTPDGSDADSFPTTSALDEFQVNGVASVAAVASLADLEALESALIGRRSPVNAWKRLLGTLPPNERKDAGQSLNAARESIAAAIIERKEALSEAGRGDELIADRLDLTEAIITQHPGHLHLVTQVRDELEDVFIGMGYEVAEGPEIESDWYNFTALNMPKHHSARSIQDSFYLDIGDKETWLLRSQTSPVQIRLLERGILPIYAIAPGRVFRRDTPDARHLPVFHQIEGIVVDEGVTFSDLAGTIETFVKAIFGGDISSRLRPAYFPFTEPSAEFEITCTICHGVGCRTCSQTGWIELGGCGMVHPSVFEATGVDPERWTGFAFGFGIDRLAFMRHEFEDLRSLIENDLRFLTQF